MKKQQSLDLPSERNRKVFNHKVGYNGLCKRLTLPSNWCLVNEVQEYDHLVIIERQRTLEIMTEREFRRLYPELKDVCKGLDYSPSRW